MPKFTRETAALFGQRGGQATAQRHADQLASWGRKGYEATRDRYFGGCDETMCDWLHCSGASALDERMREGSPWLPQLVRNPGPHPARRLPDFVVLSPRFRPAPPSQIDLDDFDDYFSTYDAEPREAEGVREWR